MKKINYLVLLGGDYYSKSIGITQYLPQYISKKYTVLCFEYPRFNNLLRFIFKKIPIIEKINSNLIIYHSLGIFPLGRSLIFINFFNHLLNYIFLNCLYSDKLRTSKIITFTPEILFSLPFFRKSKITYYISDNYTSLPMWKLLFNNIQFRILERPLLKFTHKILVTSNTLESVYKKKHSNVILFRIPSELTSYKTYHKNNFIPEDMFAINRPIIGFIGSIYEWKVVLSLIFSLLKKFSHVSFVFIGTLEIRNKEILYNLKNFSNFYYLGFKNPATLKPYMSKIDIGIIPYQTDNYGKSAYPVKIMEYLVLGKPVVTTALPSIKYLADKELIYWAKNDKEFIKYIMIALLERKDPILIKRRIEEAKKNDWDIRIKDFLKILEDD